MSDNSSATTSPSATSQSAPTQSTTPASTSSSTPTSATGSADGTTTTAKFNLHLGNLDYFLSAFDSKSKYSSYLQSTFSPENKEFEEGLKSALDVEAAGFDMTLNAELANDIKILEDKTSAQLRKAKSDGEFEGLMKDYMSRTSARLKAWSQKDWDAMAGDPSVSGDGSGGSSGGQTASGSASATTDNSKTVRYTLEKTNLDPFLMSFAEDGPYSSFLRARYSPTDQKFVESVIKVIKGDKLEVEVPTEMADLLEKKRATGMNEIRKCRDDKLKQGNWHRGKEEDLIKRLEIWMTPGGSKGSDSGTYATSVAIDTTRRYTDLRKSKSQGPPRPSESSLPYSSQSKSQRPSKPPPSTTEGWNRPERTSYTPQDFADTLAFIRSQGPRVLDSEMNSKAKAILRSASGFGRHGLRPEDSDAVDRMTRPEWPSESPSWVRGRDESFPTAASEFRSTAVPTAA